MVYSGSHLHEVQSDKPNPPNLGGTRFTPPKVGGLGGQNDSICVSPTYLRAIAFDNLFSIRSDRFSDIGKGDRMAISVSDDANTLVVGRESRKVG